MPIETAARCAAVVSKNGTSMVLLKFHPASGHLIGEIPKELGELRNGVNYRVTIVEEVGGARPSEP